MHDGLNPGLTLWRLWKTELVVVMTPQIVVERWKKKEKKRADVGKQRNYIAPATLMLRSQMVLVY